MGPPAGNTASRQSNELNNQQLAALGAFPSPASVHDDLNSPILEVAQRNTPGQPPSTQFAVPDAPNILPTEPGDVRVEPLGTPLADEMPEPDMNMLVGGALAPVHSTPPPRSPPRRSRPAFRLPSFQSLGIANPNPDRFGLDGSLAHTSIGALQQPLTSVCGSSDVRGSLPRITFGTALHDASPDSVGGIPGGRAIQSHIHRLVNTLTPPADSEHVDWSSIPTVSTALDSPLTDPGNIVPTASQTQDSSTASAIGVPSQISTGPSEIESRPPWIRASLSVLVENLRHRPAPVDSLRIISHALPSPSTTGHFFSEVIGALSNSSPSSGSSPMTWINVFHAIPGKFNLQDLPRSPPTTPGPAVGGEDYFTEKVFDSAVSIADYQQDLSQLPRSPCPVVPPNSIDVSVVERYIPPSSANEFATMFKTNGPSLLIDRLIELSPNNGSLLFIYPTRRGAQTFMREYLGPILDPILRTMAVTQGFSEELNKSLGTMAAVQELPDHEVLRHRIHMLCTRLAEQSSAAERFHGRRPQLTLSYASKEDVNLTRDAWATLYAKQEKVRIREAITRHSREMAKIPRKDFGGERRSGADLLQELLNRVERAQYKPGQEPAHGVEVSVFVITRSA